MASPARVLLAWSGGKDAAWALHALRRRDDVDVVALLTTLTDDYDRVAMQGIRRDVLHAQARSVGLPLIESRIPRDCDNARYESALREALDAAAARWPGLSTLAAGDLFLEDVRAYREARCADAGWGLTTPLFGADTAALAREMIDGGLRAAVCCVDTQQLAADYAGRAFDQALLDALPNACDPCGERGEFHTCVAAGPMFARPLALARGETVLRDARFAYTDFLLG